MSTQLIGESKHENSVPFHFETDANNADDQPLIDKEELGNTIT